MNNRMIGLVVLSAFGPYVAGGVRTDQVVVYLLAVAMLPVTIWTTRWTRAEVAVIAAWLSYMAVAVAGWLPGVVVNTSQWRAGSAFANADNLLLPLLTFLIVGVLAQERPAEALKVVARVVTVGASINAVVAIAHFVAPAAIYPLLGRFWGAGDTGDRALTVGRYTGIVGQPSVAGVLYSLGLVCAIYALRRRPVLRAAVLALLLVGGMLTVSKGFLLVGVPVAAWQLLRTSEGKAGQWVAVLLAGAGVYFGTAALNLSESWAGFDRVLALLPGGGSTVVDYTGNRYGAGSSTEPLIRAVLTDHPIGGYGLAGLATATDTAFVQALVLAGLVGVTCVAVVLLAFAAGFLSRKSSLSPAERRLFGGVVTIMVALSFATPALTANRVSVIGWALMALLLCRVATRTHESRPPSEMEDERLRVGLVER